jgi:predicted AAA+ superfamily ATPase
LLSWLCSSPRDEQLLRGLPLGDRSYARYMAILERYLQFGGMPVTHDPELDDEERRRWLHDYQRTYLERDVADLVALRDLEPFVLAMRALAEKSGKAINFAELGRAASISPNTAHRFLRYMELSYQVLLLKPYFRNREKRLTKMPKVHFVDPGISRAILNRTGDLSGEEFESAVIAEIYKQAMGASVRLDFYHLRTYDGREVDLLLEHEDGFVAIEIKMSRRVSSADARNLSGLGEILDKPLLKSFVLSLDPDVQTLADGVLALPVAWALGAPLAESSQRAGG